MVSVMCVCVCVCWIWRSHWLGFVCQSWLHMYNVIHTLYNLYGTTFMHVMFCIKWCKFSPFVLSFDICVGSFRIPRPQTCLSPSLQYYVAKCYRAEDRPAWGHVTTCMTKINVCVFIIFVRVKLSPLRGRSLALQVLRRNGGSSGRAAASPSSLDG